MPKISVLTPSIRGDMLHITQECLERQTMQDFEWVVEMGLRNRGFTLPSDMNRMLKRAKSNRIVILQDCIRIDDDALERISRLKNEMWTFPVGKVQSWGETPVWDWRKDFSGKLLGPEFWESDFAYAPKEAFYKIGGYDERYNEGWSWDNVEVAYRVNALHEYEFLCENTILGVALDHDRATEHPFRGVRELNDKRAQETKYRADRDDFYLSYLQ